MKTILTVLALALVAVSPASSWTAPAAPEVKLLSIPQLLGVGSDGWHSNHMPNRETKLRADEIRPALQKALDRLGSQRVAVRVSANGLLPYTPTLVLTPTRERWRYLLVAQDQHGHAAIQQANQKARAIEEKTPPQDFVWTFSFLDGLRSGLQRMAADGWVWEGETPFGDLYSRKL